jgi:hypothetical protein
VLLLNDRKNHIFPPIEFVEIAVENKVFCHFGDGPGAGFGLFRLEEKVFWQHWRSFRTSQVEGGIY